MQWLEQVAAACESVLAQRPGIRNAAYPELRMDVEDLLTRIRAELKNTGSTSRA